MRIGKWQLDVQDRTLTAGSQTNKLSPRAWEALVFLARRAGEVVSKEELLERFWRGDLSEDTAVRKSILEIRRALEDDPNNPTYIKTVTRQGYVLVADVIKDAADAANAIAVLPFDNLTGDPGSDHLGDGVAEELINALAHKGTVAVVARNSSFKFKGKQHDIPEIARSLNAAFVIEGSIRRHQGRVRTTVQLIDARSGLHLFSQNFDHDLDSEIQYHDAVATAAASAVLAALEDRGYVEHPPAEVRPRTLPTESGPQPPVLVSDKQRSGARMLAGLAVAGVIAAVAYFMPQFPGERFFGEAPPPKSIAVLPFQNLSTAGQAGENLTAGLYSDVNHHLTDIADLTVTPREMAQQYTLGEHAPGQIGDALNVAYLLTGMVQQSGVDARVTVQLVDTQQGTMAWSEQYQASGEDLGGALEDTARQIASQMAVTLTEAAQGRLDQVATHSWEAFQLLQQALALNDYHLWQFLGSDRRTVDLLRRSLAADPDYFDAKYWLAVALRMLPNAYEYAEELSVLAPELLAQKPDDPYVNRTNALVIELVEGDTPNALARRERLLRNAVANRGEDNNTFLVDLALFLWYVDLAEDALAVMREWQTYWPGVVSPLLAQLELSFNHDLELAAHYAEVILANKWGAPLNVTPYHQLRNDFVTSIRLLSLPEDQLGFTNPTAPRALLAVILAELDPDAALKWLDWLDANQATDSYLKPLRMSLMMLGRQEKELAVFIDRLRASHDPAHGQGKIALAVLRAELADTDSERQRYLEEAFTLSNAYWSERRMGDTYNLRGFQMGDAAIRFAILAARYDPQASQTMLRTVFDHYAAGAAHWNIADKYSVLTLAYAMSGDIEAAVEQFTLAEKFGFRSLNNLTLNGVFDERNVSIFHGLHRDRRFLNLVDQIKQRNQHTLATVKASMPQALEPGCYEQNVVEQRFSCTALSAPTLSTR